MKLSAKEAEEVYAARNKHKGDVMERRVIHRETEVATLDQMRAAAEALKGVERACDITRAKPEFVEFIRKCSPASVIAVLNQYAALVEQRDLLVGVLHQFAVNSSDGSGLCWCVVDPRVFDHSEQCLSARTALATVEQGGEA